MARKKEKIEESPAVVEPVSEAPAEVTAPPEDAGASLYRDRSGPIREKSPTEGAANFASAYAHLRSDEPEAA